MTKKIAKQNKVKSNTYPVHIQDAPACPQAANDTLFRDLEKRYGVGFAQWIMDRLEKEEKMAQG